jgi:hypothetical protein
LDWGAVGTTGLTWSKYLPDRPKFAGNTDSSGYWTFPTKTDSDWDDWDTDKVEGSIECLQPFHRTNCEYDGPCFFTGGYFILKIVGANNQVEFKTISQVELWVAYMSGDTNSATYTIKTNLNSSATPVTITMPAIPDAIKTTNLRPVAVMSSNVTMQKGKDADGNDKNEIYLTPGQSLTLDGSGSYDPEGQPLIYRWLGFGDDYGNDPPFSTAATHQATAPTEPGDYKYALYVMDGLRASKILYLTVHVSKTDQAD